MAVAYLACVISAILGVRKKSKKFWIVISAFLLIFVMSCQNLAEDEINTYLFYKNPEYRGGLPFLYELSMNLGQYFNLSFGIYNFILNSIVITCILKTVKKAKGREEIFIILYVLSCALLDVVFFKQFLATGLVFMAFKVLLYDEKPIIKYICIILTASLIHSSCIILMIFIVLRLRIKRIKNINYKLALIIIAVCMITIANNNILPGLRLLNSVISSEKIEMYLVGGGMGWILQLILSLYSLFISKYIKKIMSINMERKEKQIVVDRIEKIMLISMFLLPLCMMSMVYSRVFRFLYLLVFFEFSIISKANRTQKIKIVGLAVIYVFLIMFVNSGILWSTEKTIIPVLNGKAFWYSDLQFY